MRARKLRKSVLVGGVVVATAVLPVAVAFATDPVTGALYEGANGGGGIDGGSGATLSFQVSANGKQLTFSAGAYPGATCGAPPPVPTGQHAEIKQGRFTVKITANWTYSGSFVSGGRAKGTWKYTQDCQYPVKEVHHYHGTWAANSEPDGAASRYCSSPYHSLKGDFYAAGIVEEHASCQIVDRALAAGSFANDAPHAFTTRGWTCMGTESSPVSCSKGKSKARFQFRDEG
jgi:hypothetical protein